MVIQWSFDPILFQLGPVSVRWYGLLFVGGFIAGQVLLGRMFKREGVNPSLAQDLLLYALVGAVIGARLVHCLVYEPQAYLRHPLEILRIWEGGLASHGGVLGVFAGLALAARRQVPRIDLLWLLDRVAIPSAFAASAIRLANFLNSEIVGLPTSGRWGVVFTAVDHVPRHPVQLYATAAYLGAGRILWLLYRQRAGTRPGLLLGSLFVLVFSARLVLEFFKTPQASYDGTLVLSAGQLLSLPFIALGIWLVVRATRAANNSSKPTPLRGAA